MGMRVNTNQEDSDAAFGGDTVEEAMLSHGVPHPIARKCVQMFTHEKEPEKSDNSTGNVHTIESEIEEVNLTAVQQYLDLLHLVTLGRIQPRGALMRRHVLRLVVGHLAANPEKR